MVVSSTKADLRHKSRHIVDGRDRAWARAMLRAVGLQDEDMKKPFVLSLTWQVTLLLATSI